MDAKAIRDILQRSMTDWRRLAALVLLEIPAFIVTVWYRMYVVLMALISIVTVTLVLIVLVLWLGFGIRWGW
jgi:hypothetical protein